MGKEPDLSEFYRLSKPRRKPCGVAMAMPQISEDDRAKLEAALTTDVGIITNAAIRDWFKKRGIVITDQAVRVHRTGTCRCTDDE